MKQNRKTVLFSFHNTDFYSGATRSLLDVIDRFIEEQEWRVVAVFPGKNGTAIDYLNKKNVTILCCKTKLLVQDEKQAIYKRLIKFPLFFMRYFATVKSVKKLWNSIEEKDDIVAVYTNTSVNIVGALLKKYYNIPNIWHFREYRHEDHHIHYFLGDKLFSKFANRYSDKMIFISKSMKNYHEERGFSFDKMVTVYNDISPRYYVDREWKGDINKYHILIAGDVKEGKGQLELLKAFKIAKERHDNMHLHIAGNIGIDPYAESVRKYIIENQLADYVTIHGLVENMNELRKKCHIGVVASQKEAFGRVTIEGMLAGLLMIGSNTGGTVEIIDDGKTGFLYSLGDVHQLASYICSVLEEPDNARIIARTGQEYAKEEFISGNCFRKIKGFLSEVGR